jgi:hypoxia up-regulated 1
LYGKLKDLLGRPFDDPIVVDYRQQHDNDMVRDEGRGACAFSSQGEVVYTVEELVANILAHAKQQCEAYVGEPVRDAVITVPPFWTHRERQSLLDAADLAGLRVLSLINDETAGKQNASPILSFLSFIRGYVKLH